eukprot:6202092-Prymnesium_polylepis.1
MAHCRPHRSEACASTRQRCGKPCGRARRAPVCGRPRGQRFVRVQCEQRTCVRPHFVVLPDGPTHGGRDAGGASQGVTKRPDCQQQVDVSTAAGSLRERTESNTIPAMSNPSA